VTGILAEVHVLTLGKEKVLRRRLWIVGGAFCASGTCSYSAMLHIPTGRGCAVLHVYFNAVLHCAVLHCCASLQDSTRYHVWCAAAHKFAGSG
jgi:hypothetical protein